MSTRRALARSALLVALCVIGRPEVYSRMGTGVITVMDLVRDGTTLNDADAEQRVRGYYEELTHVERFAPQLAHVYGLAPDEASRGARDIRRFTHDFRGLELKPSLDVVTKGAPFHTNHWGWRDREYDLTPPPGTCRLALVGQSPSAGAGVADELVYEARLEERLNREHASLPHAAYEILNFAQPAYTLLDQPLYFETSHLFQFQPRIILYVAHTNEVDRVFDKLAEAIHDGEPIPYPGLRELLARANTPPGLDEPTIRLRLRPLGGSIVRWGYQQIAAAARQHHVRVVWVFVPIVPRRVGDVPPPQARDDLFAAAAEAGFQIIDLGDVWRHRDQKSLGQAPWDDHPNTFAHGLIAERLYEALRESDRAAPLGLFAPLDPTHPGEGGCE